MLLTETVLGLTVEQTELSWTKPEGKSAYITCRVSGLSSRNYVHWYQQKDGEALKRILYVNAAGTNVIPDPNHPSAGEFSVPKTSHDLLIKALQKKHSAVYYCASWDGPQ